MDSSLPPPPGKRTPIRNTCIGARPAPTHNHHSTDHEISYLRVEELQKVRKEGRREVCLNCFRVYVLIKRNGGRRGDNDRQIRSQNFHPFSHNLMGAYQRGRVAGKPREGDKGQKRYAYQGSEGALESVVGKHLSALVDKYQRPLG